jgi:hypothetical protein
MTVRELIAQASQLDPDAIVFLEDGGQLIGLVTHIDNVGNEEENEERAAAGDEPLADNWRAGEGLPPGPAVCISFEVR